MVLRRTLVTVTCLLVLCSVLAPATIATEPGVDDWAVDPTASVHGPEDRGELASVGQDVMGAVEQGEPRAVEQGEPRAVDSQPNGTVDASAIDDLVETAMADHDVAGASVAVVEGDDIVHTAGYGYADYETGDSVDPGETSFMIGSVAKLFVWTLVMQGVEDGTLDLDEPIGTYLEDYAFEGDDEVTLEHLGTHSAGYEDRIEGLFVGNHDDVADWEATLEREMPPQVRRPGETVAYSNHGTALAGLVIQEAYDQPFERLVEERLFEPLAMDGATFEQPVPDDRATVSQGHTPSGDGYRTDDPAIVGVPPAGSMSATAEDVATFTLAVIQSGAFEDERILEAESVESMVEQRATNHPGVNGVGYGYMLGEYGGEEVVWHTGGTMYFQTLFVLFPEHDVGFFASFNTQSGVLPDVFDGFVEERFGDAETDEAGAGDGADALEPDPTTTDRAHEYEGEYRSTAFQTTHEKLIGLGDARTVSVADDGTVELESPFGPGEPTRWVEVEPGVFEPHPDEDEIGFSTSFAIEDGTLYMDAPAAPYERLSWYETATVQLGLAAVAFLTLLSTLLVWPASAYRRRGWGRMHEHLIGPRLAILGAVGVLLAFVLGLAANAVADPDQFLYGYSPWLRLTLGLSLVFVGVEWRRVLAARDPDAGSTNRYGLAYLTVLVLASVVLAWLLWYWNLLGAAL